MFIDTKLRPQGEVQQVGKLRLSEAIRTGARARQQCTEKLFLTGRSCAFGAAYEAVFGTPEGVNGVLGFSELGLRLASAFPKFFKPSGAPNDLGQEIYGRNDDGWTREQIADWLESQGY